MGVELGDILQKSEIGIDSLAGKKLAIDAYNTIYQFLSIIRQRDGTPLLDFKGRITSHLSGLFYRSARLIEAGVKPIYVFDGKPPELKRATLEERGEFKEAAERMRKEALARGDEEEARKYAQATSRLTKEMVEESKTLLSLMGIPHIQAPGEGEAQAAYMVGRGDAFACASQDFDALLFGSPILVRNLTITGRRKLPRKDVYVEVVPEMINLKEALAALGIDRRKLIWIGILTGTDFNKGVKGIGPKKALKLVSEHGTLEDVVRASGGEFEVEPRDVERIFLEPEVEKEYSFEFRAPDRKGIIDFLCREHAFSEERTENSIRALEQAFNVKGAQAKLGEWV
ncbi:MAG: flap endonuclease-1 [Candidatus Micrarchaeota archaeon]